MRIAFASGKGGTGKTLLSTSLVWYASKQAGRQVVYADADVEEPNGHLLLHPVLSDDRRISVPLPTPVPDRCTGAARCQAACAFNAIMVVGTRVLIHQDLCHSCGACVMVCSDRALVEKPFEIGTLRQGKVLGEGSFIDGTLDIGQARATPAVEATVEAGQALAEAEGADALIVDCPPGTTCSTMAAVKGADLVVLVTEPTPFGLHDLVLAIEMCRAMKLSIAVVINRADLGDDEARKFVLAEGIPLLAELGFDRAVATSYAEGTVVASEVPAVAKVVEKIWRFAEAQTTKEGRS